MELLAFGNTGWGDELFHCNSNDYSCFNYSYVNWFFFALIFTPLKLSKNKFLNLLEILTQQ